MGGIPVVDNAMGICTQGAMLTLKSTNPTVQIENKPVLTINNISLIPSGTCAVKTAAALGVAQPCSPVPAGMWIPGTTSCKIKGALGIVDVSCSLICGIGGKISIVNPGAFKVIVK